MTKLFSKFNTKYILLILIMAAFIIACVSCNHSDNVVTGSSHTKAVLTTDIPETQAVIAVISTQNSQPHTNQPHTLSPNTQSPLTTASTAKSQLTTASITTRTPHEYDPEAPTICIDPGHGFVDPGAVVQSIEEDELNLRLAQKLKYALEDLGYNVMMTHDGKNLPEERFLSDYNGEKAFYAKERNAWIKEHTDEIDLVISLHCNTSSTSSTKGSRYYLSNKSSSNYNESYKLMSKVLLSVQKALNLSKEPYWYNDKDLAVLKTSLPSLLIECGFMTNQTDLENLLSDEWQTKFTSAVANGIDVYAKENINKSTPVVTSSQASATTPPTTAVTPTTEAPFIPTSKVVICIDPGHGFIDPGAIIDNGGTEIHEADINMQISQKLKAELQKQGYKVIMTHDGVNPPDSKYLSYLDSKPAFYVDERVLWINDNIDDIDIVVSVHCNWSDNKSAHGSRYYVTNNTSYGNYNSSYNLMSKVILGVKSSLGLSKEPTWERKNFAIFKSKRPSILVECGFITNGADLNNLLSDEWQTKYAKGLAHGIINYSKTYIEK